jgi:hypothetical protein
MTRDKESVWDWCERGTLARVELAPLQHARVRELHIVCASWVETGKDGRERGPEEGARVALLPYKS